MNKLIELAGNAVGLIGVVVFLAAGLARVAGQFYLLGYQSMTLFAGGVGLMVFACLAKLHVLSARE
jgi:hypothetical protein